MLPVQVSWWTLIETAKHNRMTEALTREANQINWMNAQSNRISADASERSSYANVQNALTNVRNAAVNERNAATNAWNASINAFNADTNRINANTNAYNVYTLGTKNAQSQRMQAMASLDQAESAARQASVRENEFAWNTTGGGYDIALRDIAAKEKNAEGAYLRGEASKSQAETAAYTAQSQAVQREHQNALYDAQTLNVEESTRRSKSEDAKGWFTTVDNAADKAVGRVLDVVDEARKIFDSTRKTFSQKEEK